MNIAVVSHSQDTLQDLCSFLDTEDGSVRLAATAGAAGEVPLLLGQDRFDVLILEGALRNGDLGGLEQCLARFPGLTALLVCPNPAPEFLLQAMRAGVREVLPAPVTREGLQQAVGRVRQRIGWAAAGHARGKVMAFLPCKGGSGSTFLATNLAYALAIKENRRVALIDLNLDFGEAALYVADTVPTTTVADVARQIQRLDGAFLESSMVRVLPNFGVLAAPDSPDAGAEVTPQQVERLIEVAAAHHDFVILDLGRGLNAVSIKALDMAAEIYPVLQLTLPFIRDAKRMLTAFHGLGYVGAKIRPVVNRFEKGGEIRLEDVQRTLGVAVHRTVPNSFAAVAASVNQGTPLLRLAPRDPVARTLQEMGEAMAGGGQNGHWLKSLLHLNS